MSQEIASVTFPLETFYKGEVEAILEQGERESYGGKELVQTLQVEIEDEFDQEVLLEIPYATAITTKNVRRYEEGDHVVVLQTRIEDQVRYNVIEHYRTPEIGLLALLFVALVVVIARWKGVRSLLGLGITLAIIAGWMLPQILQGKNAFFVSIASAVVIASITLYLAHGFHRQTTLALASTLGTFFITVVLTSFAVRFTNLFGMGSEDVSYLSFGDFPNLDLRGLLLGAIVIGTLGVLDDITVSQTSVVHELHDANPKLSRKELFRRGLNVGREHIASLINTLVIVYVGAALPVLLLISTATHPFWVIFNNEAMMEEVVRTLLGSASLILAVPISTALAAHHYSH